MTLNEILDRGYAKEIYEYTKSHPFADIELLTQALLKADKLPEVYDGDYEDDNKYPVFEDYELAHYYYLFARDIKGANIDLLCNAVASSQDPEEIYNFAFSIPGANIQLLEENLSSLYDEYVYLFARDINGANTNNLEKKMEFAFPKYIYLFARDIDGANIEFLQNSLLSWIVEGYDVDFSEYMCNFARDIDGANIEKMISYIKSYIGYYRSNNKSYPSESYIERLNSLIDKLEDINKQIKENNSKKVLMKTKKDLSK